MEDGKKMNNLNVIYEDNHIIVVEKPYNVPVQEDSSSNIDMITIIKEYLKKKYDKKGNVYLGLVHRLDRPVSGLMVFAKTSKAASRLSDSIRKNDFHKEYLAVVHGKVKNEDRLVDYISKNEKTFSSYIDNKNGKESILEYKLLYYDNKEDVSLIKVNLITGRHHQIRLQMSNINHPLYGDQRYGFQDKKQIMLFAYKIRFNHPVKKEKIEFRLLPKWEIIENYKNKENL